MNPHAFRRWNLKTGEHDATSDDVQDSRDVEDRDATDQDASITVLPRDAAASELDAALARALDAATAAGRFDVVSALVRMRRS